MTTQIPLSYRTSALTYLQYRQLVTALLAEGKTTGPDQSPALLEYASLNEQRMNRIEKTFMPSAEALDMLAQIKEPVLWLTLTEGWCGDAAQIVPVIAGLAALNPLIEARFLLRDENLDLMDSFLTNGGRSIPKIIFVQPDTGTVLGSWGPRPAEVQQLMVEGKQKMQAISDSVEKKNLSEALKLAIHTWYAKDKTLTTQRELLTAALGIAPIQAG